MAAEQMESPQHGEEAVNTPPTGPAQGARHGFTRLGPGPEVPRDLYRAALEDALAYTTDHDGCGDCDRDLLCDTHTAPASTSARWTNNWRQPHDHRHPMHRRPPPGTPPNRDLPQAPSAGPPRPGAAHPAGVGPRHRPHPHPAPPVRPPRRTRLEARQ